MPYCQTYLPTLCFSCFGLDPETPAADYQIHLVRTQDAAYIPPDAEAWPLFYAAALARLSQFKGLRGGKHPGINDGYPKVFTTKRGERERRWEQAGAAGTER